MAIPEAGLLSDIQILERLVASDERCIFISPLINPGHQLGPSSLDLHLAGGLRSTVITTATHVDLTGSKEEIGRQISTYIGSRKSGSDQSLVLHPGQFALGSTLEFIRLPNDIAARLEGRSSVGRLGLQVHATAGFVDPGYEGELTFELINAGNLPLRLRPGLRIGQICFFPVTDVQVNYLQKEGSKYGGDLGSRGSLIHNDPEIESRRQ